MQTDGYNCGVYVAMYAYHFITWSKFPDENVDWDHSQIVKLRLWIAFFIKTSTFALTSTAISNININPFMECCNGNLEKLTSRI